MSVCDRVHQANEVRGPASLDGELAEHARTCAACAEALGVATWLRRAASEEEPRSGLPSADHLWWRAQIIRDLVAKESLVERSTRSSRWTQLVGLGLLCLLGGLALTWLTSSLFGDLQTEVAAGSVPWRWLAGLLLAGTVVPLAGFTVLWVLWRES